MTRDTVERLARTEALFREVNERIAETAERVDADDAEFVCECADTECVSRVEADLETYEEVRSDGATFLIVDGHEAPAIESTIETNGDVAVVRKTDPAARAVVEAVDPRRRAEPQPRESAG